MIPLSLRDHGWIKLGFNFVERKLCAQPWWNGPWGVLVCLVPVALVYWFIWYLLFRVHTLAAELFALLVLLWSLGPVDLFRQLRDHIQALRLEDKELADSTGEAIIACSFPSRHGQAISISLLSGEAIRRMFAPIFWFIALGGVGVIWYRVVLELCRDTDDVEGGFHTSLRELQELFNWIPARLMVVMLALVGDMQNLLNVWNPVAFWKRSVPLRQVLFSSDRLLSDCMAAALQFTGSQATVTELDPGSLKSSLDRLVPVYTILQRVFILWLCVIAMIFLF